ncbi:HTH-type transcriptional regulator / antitoxin HigA [Algoriphagus alkaliphilus]|uniref:HTH-type transcriptional regulator / antitoxin HigA n=1 Tax=Algoriphagus alkaliphilus TaxID=279824 RepID=A0A1G5WN00_9BACT|nr:transcriptional regulator [Algoriphagus alkaliphilus]MBA4300587.1 transcriptional regulator [Cyclobacterium sp.]SDA59294.1 HTH-type transcriptional regulator / antitoxin HigA [Algoriphagus alkaliphilus]
MTRPIKNNRQYEDALERAYELMQLELPEGSIDSDELEVLSILIKEYELEHFPIPSPHPLEAIRFRMEQLNLSESDLSTILGARSRKSEILSGKRKLSLGMIRKLYEKLKIPAEVLIKEY